MKKTPSSDLNENPQFIVLPNKQQLKFCAFGELAHERMTWVDLIAEYMDEAIHQCNCLHKYLSSEGACQYELLLRKGQDAQTISTEFLLAITHVMRGCPLLHLKLIDGGS